jgi:alpha-tubulin suppressor-like RCC1 family protein
MPRLLCCGFLAEDPCKADMHAANVDLPARPVLLAGGWGFSALAENDRVQCWGRNSLEPPAPDTGAFQQSHALACVSGRGKQDGAHIVNGAGDGIMSLAAGWDHLLACTQSGAVHATGWSACGQALAVPRSSEGEPKMVAVSAGEQHR